MLVVGISGLLIAIAMPAMTKLNGVAKQMKCMRHQQQIGLYAMIYVQDNEGFFFQGNNIWTISSDKEFKPLVRCPETKNRLWTTTTGFNGAFLGGCISTPVLSRPAYLSEIRYPDETVMIGDSYNTSYLEYFACGSAIYPWHQSGYSANVLVVSGRNVKIRTLSAYNNTDIYRPVIQGGLGDALTNGPWRNFTWHDRN